MWIKDSILFYIELNTLSENDSLYDCCDIFLQKDKVQSSAKELCLRYDEHTEKTVGTSLIALTSLHLNSEPLKYSFHVPLEGSFYKTLGIIYNDTWSRE